MSKANEYLKAYNIKIRELLDVLTDEFPNNDLITTMHRRFRVALTTDRSLLITETGPEIFQHRDDIANNKWDNLVLHDWETSISSADTTLINDIDNKTLSQMICLLRNVWERYSEDEKIHVTKIIRKLLSYYVKWCVEMNKQP